MKKQIKWIAGMVLISSTLSSACPTCMGRLSADSPPFFSDYQSHKANSNLSQKPKQKVEVSKDSKKAQHKKGKS